MGIRRIIPPVITEGVRGEWWIMDGQATYADGDSGDANHESIVLDMMVRLVGDALEIDYDEDYPSPDDLTVALDQMARKTGLTMAELMIKAGIKEADEILSCMSGFSDPREFAMEHWGWKRVVDHNIETWNLTAEDRGIILDGLYEIDDQDPADEYDIYVYSIGKSFSYTVATLESGLGDNASVDWNKEASRLQAREADISAMHPYYRGLSSPIGDSIERPGEYI